MPFDDQFPANNRFRLEASEPLSLGPYHTIWHVYDERLDKRGALKILSNDADASQKEQFHREILLLHRLRNRCPHIVNLIAEGALPDGRDYILCPYHRKTLREHVGRKWQWPLKQVAAWMGQVLMVLEVLADHDVVHGNINPSSLHLDLDDNLVLTDFHGVTTAGADPVEGLVDEVSGARWYRSPELLRGEVPRFSSDVYSTAAVFHEVVTGTPSEAPGEGIDGTLGDLLRMMGHRDEQLRATSSTARRALSRFGLNDYLRELRLAPAFCDPHIVDTMRAAIRAHCNLNFENALIGLAKGAQRLCDLVLDQNTDNDFRRGSLYECIHKCGPPRKGSGQVTIWRGRRRHTMSALARLPALVFANLDFIRQLHNAADHEHNPAGRHQSAAAILAFAQSVEWYYTEFESGPRMSSLLLWKYLDWVYRA